MNNLKYIVDTATNSFKTYSKNTIDEFIYLSNTDTDDIIQCLIKTLASRFGDNLYTHDSLLLHVVIDDFSEVFAYEHCNAHDSYFYTKEYNDIRLERFINFTKFINKIQDYGS